MNTIKTLMDALKTGRPFTNEERKGDKLCIHIP